jgi:glycosyltransferase involved in cell wall biosynthesis
MSGAGVIREENSPTCTLKTLVLTPSLQKPGGIQRYTRTLQRALQDLLGGSSVRLIAAEEPEVGANGKLALPATARLRFAWRAISGAVRWRTDLVICTHLSLGPFGWMARALTGRPYWVVVHGIEAWGRLPFTKRVALAHADRVIVTSVFSREQVVKRHGINPERVASLPCALDETLLNVEPANNRLSRSLSDMQRVVLTVARMIASERYKGHDVVLRSLPLVLDKIPHLTYVIVGDGDDRPRLEKLTVELGLTQHVAFTGPISDSELAALYRRSEIFVLPSRTIIDERDSKGEGFGIVFLEAMAFGKPVIGPNYGAPTEIIRDGIDGLLTEAESCASVADAILLLLSAPETARRMGDAGSQRVRDRYCYSAFRDRLSHLVAAASEPSPRLYVGRVLEVLVAIWIITINVMYYAQFRNLLIARFGRYLLWH